MAICTELAAGATESELSPPTRNGKFCDFKGRLAGTQVWAEVKRFVDRFPESGQRPDRGRALTRRGLLAAKGTQRGPEDDPIQPPKAPRADNLRSKLDEGVPEQLSEDGVNLLFLVESSFNSVRDVASALYGEAFYFDGLADLRCSVDYRANSLFSLVRWKNVSACVLVTAGWEGAPVMVELLHNPLATRRVPGGVVCFLEQMGRPRSESVARDRTTKFM